MWHYSWLNIIWSGEVGWSTVRMLYHGCHNHVWSMHYYLLITLDTKIYRQHQGYSPSRSILNESSNTIRHHIHNHVKWGWESMQANYPHLRNLWSETTEQIINTKLHWTIQTNSAKNHGYISWSLSMLMRVQHMHTIYSHSDLIRYYYCLYEAH